MFVVCTAAAAISHSSAVGGRGIATVPTIVAVTAKGNDLVGVLKACGATVTVRPTAAAGLAASSAGDLLMLLADGYPFVRTEVPADVVAGAAARGVKMYIEFPAEGGAGMPAGECRESSAPRVGRTCMPSLASHQCIACVWK
jgi:hypothetical protein